MKSRVSGNQHSMNDTRTVLNETSAPSNDSFNITLLDPTEQDLPDQQVLGETHDVGTQTDYLAHLMAAGPELQPSVDREGENNEPDVALPEDDHNHQMDSLALTQFRPGQHNNLDLEHLIIDQRQQDASPERHTNVHREINEENRRLRLQCDDLLMQRAALENDLSTSFIEKFDLQKQLSSAQRTIEKGRAHYLRVDAEWKRDSAKLRDMTRLFEANTENARYVEILGQQKVLEEMNMWLSSEVQMRMDDNRFFACQRQAALQASSYHRACAMNLEIQRLRQWLSTVQAQLADTGKVRIRLEEELQQERLMHQEARDASYQKLSKLQLRMGLYPKNVQQTAHAGGSAPHKPSKFTPTNPKGFQTGLPKAGAPPQFSPERKSESKFSPDTFFETYTASESVPQQYRTRSKSKFTFGDNTVSQSASIATGATTGATPRTDFIFTFSGTMNHHNSLGADLDTTEFDLPKNSTSPNDKCPADIAVASRLSGDSSQPTSAPNVGICKMPLVEAETPQSFYECDHGEDKETEEYLQDPCLPSGGSCFASELPAEARDNVDLTGMLQPKMTLDKIEIHSLCEGARDYVKRKKQNGTQKPLASDFFHTDRVKAEVEMSSDSALAAEKTSEERVPIVSAGVDIAQQAHIGGSVQAGEYKATMKAEQGRNPLSPPAAYKGIPKPPKIKGRTQRRAFLRKLARARKRAAGGGASGNETA